MFQIWPTKVCTSCVPSFLDLSLSVWYTFLQITRKDFLYSLQKTSFFSNWTLFPEGNIVLAMFVSQHVIILCKQRISHIKFCMFYAKLFMGIVDGVFEILLPSNLSIISVTKQATGTPLFLFCVCSSLGW